MLALTLIHVVIAFKNMTWLFDIHAHGVTGLIIALFAIITSFGGLFVKSNLSNRKWNTTMSIKFK
jgi:hypothetical protein